MKIRVEIGDESTEYIFSENKIFVGASDSCQINLAYEGIGEKHLEIFSENGETFFTDLGSGEETHFNGSTVPAKNKSEFKSFFPVEIGGIFIYLVDESVALKENLEDSLKRLSEDISTSINLKNLDLVDGVIKEGEEVLPTNVVLDLDQDPLEIPNFQDGLLIEDINNDSIDSVNTVSDKVKGRETKALEDIKSSYDKTFEENKKKFKPEIQIPSGTIVTGREGTGSQKIKVPNDKSLTNPKFNIGSSRSGKKIVKSKNKKKKKKSIGSGALLVSYMLIVSVVYFGFYRKSPEQIKVELPIIDLYTVNENSNSKIMIHNDNYLKFLNTEKCIDEVSKLACTALGPTISIGLEGSLLLGETLFIGISEKNIRELNLANFTYTKEDKTKIPMILKNEYETYFTFEEFVANKNKATLQEFKFNKHLYEYISLSVMSILKLNLFELIEGNKEIKKIHFFVFDEFEREVTVKSFVSINKSNWVFLKKTMAKQIFKLKTIQNSYFTEGIQSYYSGIAQTHLDDYNPEIIQDFKDKQKLEKYKKIMKSPVCISSNVAIICSEMKKSRELTRIEGSFLNGNSLFLVYDLNENKTHFIEKFKDHEYNVQERKKLISTLKRINIKMSIKDFFKNDFISADFDKSEFNKNSLVSGFLDSNLINMIQKKSEVKEVVLIGIENMGQKTDVKSLISFDTKDLSATAIGVNKMNLLFLWRSKVPAYKNYLLKSSKMSIGF